MGRKLVGVNFFVASSVRSGQILFHVLFVFPVGVRHIQKRFVGYGCQISTPNLLSDLLDVWPRMEGSLG